MSYPHCDWNQMMSYPLGDKNQIKSYLLGDKDNIMNYRLGDRNKMMSYPLEDRNLLMSYPLALRWGCQWSSRSRWGWGWPRGRRCRGGQTGRWTWGWPSSCRSAAAPVYGQLLVYSFVSLDPEFLQFCLVHIAVPWDFHRIRDPYLIQANFLTKERKQKSSSFKWWKH